MLFFFAGHILPMVLTCLKIRTKLLEGQVCQAVSNYFYSAQFLRLCLVAISFNISSLLPIGKCVLRAGLEL